MQDHYDTTKPQRQRDSLSLSDREEERDSLSLSDREEERDSLSLFDWEQQMESGAAVLEFRPPDAKTSFERVYQVVRQIPEGKVATYGQVARLAGNKKWSRVVGYALHVNPEPGKIPCHRVVNRMGEPSSAFAFGGVNRQIELLEAEGVAFQDGKVDLKMFQWEL